MNTKADVQAALIERFQIGTSRALRNEHYGELLIVSTGVAGNLILYKNFYPAAYIRPESLTAVLNAEEPFPPNEDFHKLQQLIKETCAELIECYSVDEFIEFVDMNQDFGKVSQTEDIHLTGYNEESKLTIQDALIERFSIGTSRALLSKAYGELIIVSTGVAGNLILQRGFYPVAYIRPETLTAALNVEEDSSGQLIKIQKLIKETCTKIIECHGVDELIEFVDMNRAFGK